MHNSKNFQKRKKERKNKERKKKNVIMSCDYVQMETFLRQSNIIRTIIKVNGTKHFVQS
jgi:hypothetical protein